MFGMEIASAAVRLIVADEADMFGKAVGWEPGPDGGVYIIYDAGRPDAVREIRYYSGGDIMNAATSGRLPKEA